MKSIAKYLFVMVCAALVFACQPHVPEVEQLPTEAIDFTYEVTGDTVYELDYYVGATIKFYPTVALNAADGALTWNFGDGTAEEQGDTVLHKFTVAGNYTVTVANQKGEKKANVIYISDIKPIVTLIQEDSLCVVDSSFISFDVELPNPDKLDADTIWTFPAGTTNEAGQAVASFTGSHQALGKVKFARAGSQTVTIQVNLGKRTDYMRPLEAVKKDVQVALNEAAPTLYYAVKEGNIMSIKIPATPIDGVSIDPFNMGVASGQHPLNILFNKGSLYILDAGKQFTYQNEEGQLNGGDGQITVMSKDASTVELMMTNVGGPGFQDPFYGYIDTVTANLYFSDRNTGIITAPLSTRNETYSAEKFPYLVQNNYLGYYGKAGLAYGAITSCFGKIGDTYYWSKTYNGKGIWRFLDSDILQAPVTDKDPSPAAGVVLTAFSPKTFVYNKTTGDFFFVLYGDGEGFYKCTLADLGTYNQKKDLPAPIVFADDQGTAAGKTITQITTHGVGEGSSGEYLGITQLALDEATGNVYFGLRSGDSAVPSGLVMYEASSNSLKFVDLGEDNKNIQIYGVAVNPTPAQLF